MHPEDTHTLFTPPSPFVHTVFFPYSWPLQETLISKILESATYILNCDRVSLYLVDHVTSTLTCIHSRDEIAGIKIPIGTGIAGQVASTGSLLNVRDAYKDTRFYPGVDKQTGYRTKGVLCAPIKFGQGAKGGRVEAVIQAINKKAPKVRRRAGGVNEEGITTSERRKRREKSVRDRLKTTDFDRHILPFVHTVPPLFTRVCGATPSPLSTPCPICFHTCVCPP